MKFLGLNILTNNQLRQITENHWEKTRKLFKLKKVYKISRKITKMPKCNQCDENRKITVTLPDGSTRKIFCSCDKNKYKFVTSEVKEFSFLVQEDGQVCVIDTERMYSNVINRIKVLSTKEEVEAAFKNSWWRTNPLNYYMATKDLAEYGVKLLDDTENKD